MNQMSVLHFMEFYTLEAMRAGLLMHKSSSPHAEFRKSFVKLEQDVQETFDKLTDTMAQRVRLYLWAACLGEARHAERLVTYSFEELPYQPRGRVYKNAPKYGIDENLESVMEIFEQSWNSAYGGRAWGKIADAIALYDEVTPATFIDHAVDLEHNGGCVFSKDAEDAPISLNNHRLYDVKAFLDHKFSADILKDDGEIYVSGKVYRLLQRYSNVVETINLGAFVNKLEWLDPFDVTYGDETLTIIEKSVINCRECDDVVDEDDVMYDDDGNAYCEHCYYEHYKSCGHCGCTLEHYDAIAVKREYYCEACAEELGYVKCEYCDEYEQDYIVSADSCEIYCQDCAEKQWDYCEDCNEWYAYGEHGTFCEHCEEWHCDETHADEHYTPAQLQDDADGIFDNPIEVLTSQPTQDTFDVNYGWGTQQVTALCYKVGKFVVAYMDKYGKTGWKLCHKGTGWSLGATQERPRALMMAGLRVSSMLDWDAVTRRSWEAINEKTKNSIKEVMASYGVM